jgi:hypothetical protein
MGLVDPSRASTVAVSEADLDDLAAQVPGVEHAVLDFAVRRRGVAGQTDTFPAALLLRAGGLGIDLAVTHCEVLGE